MNLLRKSELKMVAVMITLAMVFCIVTGMVPGTSIKANAAEIHLSDLTVGDTVPKGVTMTWDDKEDTDFYIHIDEGEYWYEGCMIDPYDEEDDNFYNIFERVDFTPEGGLATNYGTIYKPRDINTGSLGDTWYVKKIDLKYHMIYLTGTKTPPKFCYKDYNVGERVTVADVVKWGDSINFTLVLKGGSYMIDDNVQASDYTNDKTWITWIYTDGSMECDYTNALFHSFYQAYDANRQQVSDKWYIDSIDVENKTVTLTGTEPTL